MASLLELVQHRITPDLALRVSGLVGETPAATESALHRAALAVLAAILGHASTAAGAERVQSLVTEGGWGADLLRGLGVRLTAGGATGNLLSSGARLVSSLLGPRRADVTDLVASGSGVQRGSASTILALGAPLVMSVIGTQIASRGLSVSGLASMLASERASLSSILPAGAASLLGLTDPSATGMPDAVAAGAVAPAPDDAGPAMGLSSTLSRWWPTLLMGLAAVAMLFLLARGRPADVASTRTDSPAASPRPVTDVALPGGRWIKVSPDSSVHQLSTFLAGPVTDLPRRFLLEDLHFESGSSRLTPAGRQTADSLLAVLKAYPTVHAVLDGHADATGDAGASRALSRRRAEAVEELLIAGGVAADRLRTEGHREDRPPGGNEAQAGRARSRQLELVVVQR
jgi:outer membrane protein OmpA-like peptidoglycan-associated protein